MATKNKAATQPTDVSEEAIHAEGVADEGQDETPDPRMEALAAIAKRRGEHFDGDWVPVEPEEEDPPVEEEDPEEEPMEEPSEEDSGQDEEEDEPVQQEQRVTIIVNGQAKEISLSEAIARAQKAEAADHALEEAKRLQRELEDRLRVSDRQVETPKPEPEDRKALIREYQEALYAGEEGKAAEIFEKLVKPSGPTEKDVEGRVQAALKKRDEAEEVRQAQENARLEALARFKENYKDVAGDESAFALANQLSFAAYNEVLRRAGEEGRQATWDEIYSRTGDMTREYLKTFRGGQDLAQKRDKKRQAVDEPKKASSKVPPPPEQKQPKTPSQVIAEIAKMRGQIHQ